MFWLQIQKELHVVGERQKLSVAADIVIAEFDDVFHMIFVWIFQNCLHTLGLSSFRFYFKRHAFSFYPDKESGVLQIVI